MGQAPEALKLLPQVDQSLPPRGKGQVLSHALGHHAEPLVLARENGTERALRDELLVIAGGGSSGAAEEIIFGVAADAGGGTKTRSGNKIKNLRKQCSWLFLQRVSSNRGATGRQSQHGSSEEGRRAETPGGEGENTAQFEPGKRRSMARVPRTNLRRRPRAHQTLDSKST